MRTSLRDTRRRIVHAGTPRGDYAGHGYAASRGQEFKRPDELRLGTEVPTCLWRAAGTFLR